MSLTFQPAVADDDRTSLTEEGTSSLWGAYTHCPHPLCGSTFEGCMGKYDHIKALHPKLLECAECGSKYDVLHQIEKHAVRSQHAVFSCPDEECKSRFARHDTMKRHFLNHTDNAMRYSCPYCKKYKGKFGFKRNDHLTQHLRNYHHIGEHDNGSYQVRSCPHHDCLAYRGTVDRSGSGCHFDNAFKKASEFTKHMKDVHDESPFPCTIAGCSRVRRKGYFRKRDLVKHVAKAHPEVEQSELGFSEEQWSPF